MSGYVLALTLLIASQVNGQAIQAPSKTTTNTATRAGVTMHARGTFVVKIGPTEASAIAQDAGLARMTIDKTFSGELDGDSKGEMLTGGNETTGAGAYVALERVTGKLGGRNGGFLLMHDGTMMKDDLKSTVWHVVIVPQSGTGDLAGLTGKMTIVIEGGKHSYDLEYQLP